MKITRSAASWFSLYSRVLQAVENNENRLVSGVSLVYEALGKTLLLFDEIFHQTRLLFLLKHGLVWGDRHVSNTCGNVWPYNQTPRIVFKIKTSTSPRFSNAFHGDWCYCSNASLSVSQSVPSSWGKNENQGAWSQGCRCFGVFGVTWWYMIKECLN